MRSTISLFWNFRNVDTDRISSYIFFIATFDFQFPWFVKALTFLMSSGPGLVSLPNGMSISTWLPNEQTATAPASQRRSASSRTHTASQVTWKLVFNYHSFKIVLFVLFLSNFQRFTPIWENSNDVNWITHLRSNVQWVANLNFDLREKQSLYLLRYLNFYREIKSKKQRPTWEIAFSCMLAESSTATRTWYSFCAFFVLRIQMRSFRYSLAMYVTRRRMFRRLPVR